MSVLEINEDKSVTLVHNYAVHGGELNEHIKYLLYLLLSFNIVLIIADNADGNFIQSANESELFKEKNINMTVIGCGTEYKNFDVNLRILGPFGSKDPVFLGPPTVFTTSENVPAVPDEVCNQNNIKLQLGFKSAPDATVPHPSACE